MALRGPELDGGERRHFVVGTRRPPSRDTRNLGSFIPGAFDTSYELALEPSVVAGWVADPAQNFGLAHVSQSSDGAEVRSSEASMVSMRPLLTVVFVLP